jgi:uncharacterized Tic20 family protein
MPAPVSPPPGWYFDGVAMRWWTGDTWGPYGPAGTQTSTTQQQVASGSTMSVFAHVAFFFLAIILALIFRQTEGKQNEYVRHHSTEALNFQLTFFIFWIAGFIALFVIGLSTADANGSASGYIAIPFVLMFITFFGSAAMSIVGAVHASRGDWWRYPISIRFVRGARGRND